MGNESGQVGEAKGRGGMHAVQISGGSGAAVLREDSSGD